MNQNNLEGLQILFMIFMAICIWVILHQICLQFGVLKWFYGFIASGVGYCIIEENLN